MIQRIAYFLSSIRRPFAGPLPHAILSPSPSKATTTDCATSGFNLAALSASDSVNRSYTSGYKWQDILQVTRQNPLSLLAWPQTACGAPLALVIRTFPAARGRLCPFPPYPWPVGNLTESNTQALAQAKATPGLTLRVLRAWSAPYQTSTLHPPGGRNPSYPHAPGRRDPHIDRATRSRVATAPSTLTEP